MFPSSKSNIIDSINDLPYIPREEILRIINSDDIWLQLAENYMKFSHKVILNLKAENNPGDKLLRIWGVYNHTIIELFAIFKQMKLYQAMSILKPYVDEKYHKFIPKNEKPPDNVKLVPIKGESPPSENINFTSSDSSELYSNKEISSLLPKVPYEELELATDNWNTKNILGAGGFGTVFKGEWKNTMVAVKRIECKRCEKEKIFQVQWHQLLQEINILNSRIHENVLLLYAYSTNGDMPCLVYQFMANGSLENKLFSSNSLSWLLRHQIATGIACGLQYLHTTGDRPLIHGDIKTANILLDKNMEPKIGDFGLARYGIKSSMKKVSRIQGTRPYLPAEFINEGKMSTKVDTFSYGVVIYEMATGLRAYDRYRSKHKFLKDFVESFPESEQRILIDKKPLCEYEVVFYNFMSLGKHCCKQDANERPEMTTVFQNLKSVSSI